MMIDLGMLVIFDPNNSVLYSAKDLPMSMNGNALQLTLPRAMATGGLVTEPTLTLLGEAGPEMVIPLSKSPSKKKRKVSKYQRIWGKELKKIKKTSRLKNGSYRKGWDRSKEFAKAHKMTKKMLK